MKKLVLLFAILLSSCSNVSPSSQLFNVVLEKNESFVSLDGYSRKVSFGDTASFNIEFHEGFNFKSLSHGVYQDGKIILDNVIESTRIIVYSEQIQYINITIVNDNQKGVVDGDYQQTILEGETFNTTVTPNSDYEFIGWSSGDTLDNGGELISATNNLSIVPDDDLTLFTNYISKGDANYIYYYLNGGKMKDGSESTFYKVVIPVFADRVKNPNTSIGTDTIIKDGYTLYSWNTEPDGSGTDIGLGSRVDTRESIKLYAKWVKWTDESFFEYEAISDNSYAINSCNCDSKFIVIPESIEGHSVTTLKKESFKGLNVEEIVLPTTISTIEESSFSSLLSLRSIKFFDNIYSASQNAFQNTPELSTYKINAVIEPRFNKATANSINYLNNIEKNKAIIAGGSIVYTSIIADTFLAKSNEFDLGICSGDVGAGFRFYIDLACALAKPNDIVAGVPLYWGGAIGGSGGFNVKTFQILESNYDLLQMLDVRYYTSILDALCLFNDSRLQMNPVGYNSVEPYVGARGIAVPIGHNPNIDVSPLQCSGSAFGSDSLSFANHLKSVCEEKGVKLFIVPGGFINVTFNDSFYKKWDEIYPYALGNISDFEYPFDYFSNTRWHLAPVGANQFTNQIVDLLSEEGCFD